MSENETKTATAGTGKTGLIGASADRLSPRQRQVLLGIADGNTTREIAMQLCLSAKTVEYHRAKLMESLGIYDVALLTRWAIREHLIEA